MKTAENNCIITLHDSICGRDRKYNLSPLVDILECGGIKSLVDILRDVHHNYASVLISCSENDIAGYIDESVPDQLFYLKALADSLEEVQEVAE